jgi:catechol 2,3-dioxygenase-like lactoylglutathione lyase family enzyme
MLTGFDHVTIAVRELDQAVRDHALMLGASPSWRGAHPSLGTEGALFALSNAAIELVSPQPSAAESEGLRTRLEQHGEGLTALAFCIADAAAWTKQLRERGLRATLPEEGEALGSAGEVRRYRTVELSERTTRGISVFGVERPDLSGLRSTSAMPAASVEALDHVVLRTADPEAALALYGQGLGMRLALDRVIGGLRMLFFRQGGVTLECVHDSSVGERDVLYGLAFRVRDLEGAHARISAGGLEVSELRAGQKPGTRVFSVKSGTCGVPTLFLRDPARD